MVSNWMKCALGIVVPALVVCGAARADGPTPSIRIDVPVKLEKANVVFNMNHFVMRGDMPLGLRYMDLLEKHFRESGTQGKIIGVFYGEGGYLTLNDSAYNAARNVTTGNPYKWVIADMIRRGVVFEECGVTMQTHHWTNRDLLPGVLVNSAAVRRLIQLDQEGYVQIQP